MNKYAKWIFMTFFFTGFIFLLNTFSTQKVQAAAQYDCNPDAARMSQIATPALLNAYLTQIGVPTSIYVPAAGKTLGVNYYDAYNKCILVYGAPADVVPQGRKVNVQGSNGEWLYLGYNKRGLPFTNPDYPPLTDEIDYIQTSDFVYQPWNDANLQYNINNVSTTKPYTTAPGSVKPTYWDPKLGRVRTVPEELDRAIDEFYLDRCGTNCSLGKRGYFPYTNNYSGVTLVGSNLQNYASVDLFPDEFSSGLMNLYRRYNGSYRYAAFFLPPYVNLIDDIRDLTVTINSITPSSVMEDNSYVVNFTVCNQGKYQVTNPVINFGDTPSETGGTKTIYTTLKPTDCYTGNVSQIAEPVSADTNKTFYMTVNKDNTNPLDENNTANNTATKGFTIIHRVVDYSIKITSWTPTTPNSNQQITVNYQLCNNSNVPVSNVNYKVGYTGAEISNSIPNMSVGQCINSSVNVTTDDIKDYTDTRTLTAQVTSGTYLSEDINNTNNTDTKTATVRNPDASTDISVDNDSSNNTVGDAKVKVINNTWGSITQNCSTSSLGCLAGTTKSTYNIYVYDTKFTADTSDDVLVAHYTPTYNLTNFGDINTYDIGRSLFTNWVQNHYPNTYQLVQFRIVSQIPEYAGEVNWDGNPSYTNNYDEKILNYFPPRPDIAATKCSELQSSITTYFTTPSGFNPIKICAGHYPTYPSTTVESGMQAYHYVEYRFFPEPIPKYTVTTPESDVTNPNHFSQIFQLPITENSNQMGDVESMFFPNSTSNGYYKERGRYMPTGGTFNFNVYKKNTDGSKGQQIALGTVSYNIPNTCYSQSNLDIKHQYACDEIMFFLPNPDTIQKFNKPSSYNSPTVTYPISGTKIPYLNPGKYTFDFNANENFRYFYQTNQSNSGYRWNNPQFK